MKYSIKAALAVAALAAGAALTTLPMTSAGAAAKSNATPTYGVSFATSGAGNTASWTTDTNQSYAVLHVASTAPGSEAEIKITGIPAGAQLPAFVYSPGFAAVGTGTAPYDFGGGLYLLIQTGDGHYVWGYPSSPIGAGCDTVSPAAGPPPMCWGAPLGSVPNTYGATYDQVQSYVNSHGGVASAAVVADASLLTEQPGTSSYTVVVSALDWGNQMLVPRTVANRLTAKDTCGSYADRHWTVTSLAGTGVTFFVKTRLNSGHWRALGHAESVGPGGSVSFVTTRGTTLKLGYPNGLGDWVYSTFASHVSSC
ncbi:MAG TPA: hypothetical protein VMU95_20060 [Trebonia sp.]|nr:hypothetical protein [Streptosporangiaceae bacterium]HUN34305.1 hypothetical protein [Trebonia sp.]